MAKLVDKRIVNGAELNEYIETQLSGWTRTKFDKRVGDMIYENGNKVCFIYKWVGGFQIQKLD